MTDITCNHCGRSYSHDRTACPYCHTPSPAQQEVNLRRVARKFILLFLALVIFCIVMILWLPPDW